MTTDAHPFSRRDLLKGLTMGGLALCSSAVARADRSSTKESNVSRIFITGSTDGLGLAAARTLMAEGHQVVLHAPQNVPPTLPISLRGPQESSLAISVAPWKREAIAEQVNRIGRMEPSSTMPAFITKHPRIDSRRPHEGLAVNTLAPYMLTALIERPQRLIYLTSGMHRGANGSLRDIDWRSVDGTRAPLIPRASFSSRRSRLRSPGIGQMC